jgi:hypothetical protein
MIRFAYGRNANAPIRVAITARRHQASGGNGLFVSNLASSDYTKGGWKAAMDKLMAKAKALAEKRSGESVRFRLEDRRLGI